MRLRLSALKYFVLTVFFSLNAKANLNFEDAIFPELITSARALAMGNAFICRVDDSSAAFYNPAGLGTVRYGHFHLTNLSLESNKGLLDTAAGGRMTDAMGNISKGFSKDGVRELLLENRGAITNSRFQAAPNILFRYFTAGFLLKKHTRATIGPEADDPYEYADRIDFGPYIGMNFSLFGGILKFGATGILLNRHEAIGEAPNDVTFELEDDDYNKGWTEYIVGGARLTLPWKWLPTFAATLHNATNKEFRGRAAGAPTKIQQQVDVGFSLTPQVGKTIRWHFEINYKDIGDKYGTSSSRRILLGSEIDIKRTFFVRFGYGDGFGTFGIGMRTRKLEFDLTSYAVDSTANDFRGEEDRRFVLGLSSGF